MAGAKRRLLFAAAATALALVAASCGGGGGSGGTSTEAGATTTKPAAAAAAALAKAAYVTKMRAIGKSLGSSLGAFTSATTPKTAATALQAAQGSLRAAAARLSAINPPAAVRAEHAKLVKGVRDFADELGPVIAKLRKGTLSAAAKVPTLKGYAEIESASTAIATKGYKIGG